MRNTKAVGELSEAVVLAKFLELGWKVLHPWGDNQRYDLVIDRGQGFERVQVKTGRIRDGKVIFNAASVDHHMVRSTYQGEADLFGVYCPDNGKVYLTPVGTLRCNFTLRLEPPKNGQGKGIVWAKDYEL